MKGLLPFLLFLPSFPSTSLKLFLKEDLWPKANYMVKIRSKKTGPECVDKEGGCGDGGVVLLAEG